MGQEESRMGRPSGPTTSLFCVFCNRGPHQPTECREYRSAYERRIRVEQKGFCIRCLREHNERLCGVTGRCDYCQKRGHHEALCIEQFPRKGMTCKLCAGSHFVMDCDCFVTVEERLEEIARCRLCERCLADGHRARDCNYKAPCKFCGSQSHHPALCKQTRSLARSTSPSPTVPSFPRRVRRSSSPRVSSTSQFKPYRPPAFIEATSEGPSQAEKPAIRDVQNSVNQVAFAGSRTGDCTKSRSSDPNCSTPSECTEPSSASKATQLEPVSSSTGSDRPNDTTAAPESLSCTIPVYVPSKSQKKGVIEFSESSRETSRSASFEDDDRRKSSTKHHKKHKNEKRHHKHSKKQKKLRVRTKDLAKYTADLKMIKEVLEVGIEAERKKHQETVKAHDLALQMLRASEQQNLRLQLEKQAYQQALGLSVEFERWRIRRRIELHKQARNAASDGTANVLPSTTANKGLVAATNGSAGGSFGTVTPKTSPCKRLNDISGESVSGAEKKRQCLANDALVVGVQQHLEETLHGFDDDAKLKYAIFVAENLRDAVTVDELIQFIEKRDPTVAEKLTQAGLVPSRPPEIPRHDSV